MTGEKIVTTSKKSKTRVELHVHLDGSMRHETIWELLKKKNLPLPGNGSFRDLRNALLVTKPIDLAHFLQPFAIFMPAIQDDLEAIERVAYEFMEDKAQEQVLYVEPRIAPHFLLSKNRDMEHLSGVIKAIHAGLFKGQLEFGVQFRIILATLIGQNTEEEVLKLCETHKDYGVVAIDKAGVVKNKDEVPEDGMLPQIFQRAANLGLHRTVHAGECGSAEMVKRALNLYQAERIGHGYRVVDDLNIYRDCLEKNVHFESCPWSSLLTGSVPLAIEKHPIVRFAEDRANFSISTDDQTVTGYRLPENMLKIQKWGLTEADAFRAAINGARASFLPQTEKDRLVKTLENNLFSNIIGE